MPKAITVEMLEAMSPDQRKTLHQNALARETPAAKEIIEMLKAGDFIAVAKAAAKPRTARAAKTTVAKTSAPKVAKATAAKHGRQS